MGGDALTTRFHYLHMISMLALCTAFDKRIFTISLASAHFVLHNTQMIDPFAFINVDVSTA